MVETETVLEMSRGEVARDYVKQVLAREDVRSALIARGVDPLEAIARVDSLTDSEARQLANQIEQLPAGGGALGFVIAILVIVILAAIDISFIASPTNSIALYSAPPAPMRVMTASITSLL